MLGGSNPVAGPYFNFTLPEPTGVVGVVAPAEPPLLGIVSRVAPVIVGGNTAVVLTSEEHPLSAIELAEAIATSDVPGGVVNVLTGFPLGARRRGWRRTSTSTRSTSPRLTPISSAPRPTA